MIYRLMTIPMLSLALLACSTESAKSEQGGSGSSGDVSSTSSSGTTDPSAGETEPGSEASTGSSSDGDSSSGGGVACPLGEEDITLDFPTFADDDGFVVYTVSDVPCDVTADGFVCELENRTDPLAVDPLFEGLAPVPWVVGDAVTISLAENVDSFTDVVIVRDDGGGLLASAIYRTSGDGIEPIALETLDVNCAAAPSFGTPLLATYTLGDESLELFGSSSGQLGAYQVFQAEAKDFGDVSLGEVEVGVTYAAIRTAR